MMQGFQKIKYLSDDKYLLKRKKEVITELMSKNKIQCASVIRENNDLSTKYTLYLMVRLENLNQIVELLNSDETLKEYVLLEEERIKPNLEINEEINEEINSKLEYYRDEIKNLRELYESNPINSFEKTTGFNFFANIIYTILLAIIILMELGFLLLKYEEKDYIGMNKVIVMFIIEIPIIVLIYRKINKKKDE